MTKKKRNKADKCENNIEKVETDVEKKDEVVESSLPQNIVSLGEYNEEEKNIYISQAVYKKIHKFSKNKTENESGGMLVGKVIYEFGKTNIVINGFIQAKHCEATPTTLKFTHETWEACHKEIAKNYKDEKIVGWIHTHPDFGIFLSDYDKFIHKNFFSEENQIAYVVDPIRDDEGFYFWINGNLERCKGFFVFAENGEKIIIEKNSEKKEETKIVAKNSNNKLVTIIISLILIISLMFNLILYVKVVKIESYLGDMSYVQNLVNSEIDSRILKLEKLHNLVKETGENKEK